MLGLRSSVDELLELERNKGIELQRQRTQSKISFLVIAVLSLFAAWLAGIIPPFKGIEWTVGAAPTFSFQKPDQCEL